MPLVETTTGQPRRRRKRRVVPAPKPSIVRTRAGADVRGPAGQQRREQRATVERAAGARGRAMAAGYAPVEAARSSAIARTEHETALTRRYGSAGAMEHMIRQLPFDYEQESEALRQLELALSEQDAEAGRIKGALRAAFEEGDLSGAEYAAAQQNLSEQFPLLGGVINDYGPAETAVGQLAETVAYAPAGVYMLGEALTRDIGGLELTSDKPLTASFPRTAALGKEMGRQVAEDVTNPRENLGYLTADILGAAGLGAGAIARTGGVGRALARGDVRGAGRNLVHPDIPRRTFQIGDLEVEGSYSRSALARAGQQAGDKLRRSGVPTGVLRRREESKAGYELGQNLEILDRIERAPAEALRRSGKRLSPGRLTALRVVEEGAPIETRIRMHQEEMVDASPQERFALTMQIGLLRKARRYVDESGPKPVLSAKAGKRTEQAQELIRKNAARREEILTMLERLSPEQIEGRIQAPGRVAEGARFVSRPLSEKLEIGETETPTAFIGQFVRAADRDNIGQVVDVNAESGMATVQFRNRQTKRRATVELPLSGLRLERDPDARLVGAEDFEAGTSRIPYERGIPGVGLGTFIRGVKGSYGGLARGRAIGFPRELPETRKPFTGRMLLSGRFRTDTTNLVGEDFLKAQRLGAVLRGRDALLAAADDIPENTSTAVPIRTELLKNRPMPRALQDAIDAYDNADLTAKAIKELDITRDVEALRAEVFPDMTWEEFLSRKAAGDPDVEGIKWVDPDFLDQSGLAAPPAVLIASTKKAKGARIGLGVADVINDASRVAILYLKPAYAVPNILGNAALLMVNSGPFAPFDLARSARLSAKLGDTGTAIVDSVMGEGFAAILRGETNVGKAVANRLANVWGQVVDVPFRRATFLHEARRAGYRTLKDVRRLLEDENLRPELVQIARRANREIIDYSRLSPMERAIVRRIIFFYPWIKGATIYGARFPFEHPIQSAGLVQLGREGKEKADRDLGPRPAYTRGQFKVGERDGMPLTVNPASVSVLQTPLDVGEAAYGFLTGDVRPGAELAGNLTPFLGAAVTSLAGYDAFERREKPQGLRTFIGELTGDLPQVRLAEKLGATEEERARRLYPETAADAWWQFGLGGAAPRPFNKPVAAERQAQIERETMDSDERAQQDFEEAVQRTRRVYKAAGEELDPEYERLAKQKFMYERAQESLKEDLEVEKLTEAQKVSVLMSVGFQTSPEFGEFENEWLTAYQDALGDPRDQGETPSGQMRALHNRLYDVLGFNLLERYHSYRNLLEDQAQVERG